MFWNRWSRRQLLEAGLWTGLWAAAGGRVWSQTGRPAGTLVAKESWGELVELSPGIWAMVSTPLASNDWTTGANGGLIAGRERVLAIDSFVRPAGARWLVEQARQLTGRPPSDIVLTHFHGDHANGLEGYLTDPAPRVWMTRTTLDLVRQADAEGEQPAGAERLAMLEGVGPIDESKVLELDLGGRSATVQPRRGHTPSDVTVEIAEPSIVFGGDLVWNGFFPNYRDTLASAFTDAIRALRRQRPTTYVPGHGALADGAAVDALLDLVEQVGDAAQAAHASGVPLTDAAASFALPATASDWVLFNPKYFEVAFKAWYAELG